MKKYLILALLALPGAVAAEGPATFRDGRVVVIDRNARPRTLTFYDKDYALVKKATVAAKETGESAVDVAGGVVSLAYIDPKGDRRLAVYDSSGRSLADLPVKTLLAIAWVEKGKILAGDDKTGVVVMSRDGEVLEKRPPTKPDISEKELYKERKRAKEASKGGATAGAGALP